MLVSILGKQRKGKKSFELYADDEFGFNIECFRKGLVIRLNNLTEIIWMNCGENVKVTPSIEDPVEFMEFDKIIIMKAKRKEDRPMQTISTT